MAKKELRVFHGVVNFGTQAGLFAKGLRDLGVKASSFTGNDPFNRPTDYQFRQRKGILRKLWFYEIWYPWIRFFCFFKFNTFHFYFGKTLHKRQWDLPFYRLFGKKVIMHYLGNDIELYQWSIENYQVTNMQFLFSSDEGAKHDQAVHKRRSFEKKYIDKELVCSPQYFPFIPGVEILPLSLDISNYICEPPLNFKVGEELKILHAPTNRRKKGTQFLIEAVEKLKEEGFLIDLEICEGISYTELMTRYKNCHVSVNALLGGWYGTVGIEAMALGRPIITFLRPSFLNIMKFDSKAIPIISANKDTIYKELKKVALGEYNLKDLAINSRKYVEEYHDLKKNCKQLKAIYNDLYL